MDIREAIERFLVDVIADIRADQDAKGIKASGFSADSLVYGFDDKSGVVEGASYFTQQTYGRKPGKMPPVNDILAWMEHKRIAQNESERKQEGIAFAIAKKISKVGTEIYRGKAKGLDIESIIKKRTEELQANVGASVGVNITQSLIKELNAVAISV